MARILVVNDDPDLVEMCCMVLEVHGHEASPMIQPERDALLRIVRDFRPDLILLDLVMPDATGEDVLGWLRAEPALRVPPILVASALADAAGIVRHLRVEGFLPKPFTDEELNAAVDKLVQPQGAHPSA